VVNTKTVVKPKQGGDSFAIRKLSRSGKTRYLSVGTILPNEWEAVKVFTVEVNRGYVTLRIEPIL